MQAVNQHFSLLRFVQHLFRAKRPSVTETQLGQRLHAAFTWNVETEVP